MKKIGILFIGLLFLVMSCREDKATAPVYSIVGTWKPVKMVETIVTSDPTAQPVSETYDYLACEQMTRWVFNADLSGKSTIHKEINSQCVVWLDQTLNYTYDSSTGVIAIKYVTYQDNGKIMDLKENSLNLKIETNENGVYNSKTYTMVRVP